LYGVQHRSHIWANPLPLFWCAIPKVSKLDVRVFVVSFFASIKTDISA